MKNLLAALLSLVAACASAQDVTYPYSASGSGSSVLTNGQVLATNIANDSIGPAQTVSQMSYVTNAASFSATIGAASGRWFKIGSWNINSPTAERTFFAQYAEGSGNTPARIMLKTGGAGVAQAGRSVAVMYAESSATNGFGGVGSDSSGNVYVQVTNLSHSAIQISLQASGWCDGFPDSGPSFGTITTNPISDIAASTIVYLPITGNSLIAPHGGVFDYLTVGGSNVQTLAASGGGGGATDVVYAVRTAGEYYAYNTIVTQTFPTALRNDGATWNTNTHRWTPSGTGIAHVQVATYLTNNASGGRITLFHYVNGVLTYAYSDGALPAINDLKHVGSHAFVVTNANDVHSFTFYNNGGMGAYNGAPELNNITIWRVP